jgi:bacteriorhodopsin
MGHNSPIDDRPFRIPPIVWILGAGLIVAFVAIFVFNVPVSTVLYYGFFLLMMGSHFFMHGSHAGHGGPAAHQHGSTSNADESNKNEHSGHTGGCH